MDMAERPVVDAGPPEIVQGTRGIGGVSRIVADVRMQQSDGKRFAVHMIEPSNEILQDFAARIADAVNDGQIRGVFEHRHSFEFRAEPMTARRIRELRLPAVEGIVVAVANEGPDADVMEPVQAVDEFALGAKAAVRPIVDVSSHEQRVHLLSNAQFDDVFVGLERCVANGARDIVRGCCPQSPERAVEMQIGRMDESKTGHGRGDSIPAPSTMCR